MKVIPSLEIHNKSYNEFSNIKNSIVYLDPPYKNTSTVYKCNNLDYEEFYKWCEKMNEENIVLISGYHMPDDFEVVYEFTEARSTLQGGSHESKYEKLFMVKDNNSN